MSIFYTYPYEPNRFVRFVFRYGLILLCIASVVFTTIGFLKAYHNIERGPHGHKNSTDHRRSVDSKGRPAH